MSPKNKSDVQGEESKKTIDKRKLLFLAATAAAGLSLKPLTEKAYAAPGDALLIGQDNSGDDSLGVGHTTGLDATVNSGNDAIYSVLHVQNYGIQGGNCPPCSISGYCGEGIGVAGYSEKGWAVHGNGVGKPVNGEPVNCVGVDGYSDYGIAVRGRSQNGTALKVEGKSDFNGKIGDPLVVGEVNQADPGSETVLIASTTEIPGSTWKVGLRVINNGETGEAIAGEAPFQGVHGKSPKIAIRGECDDEESIEGGTGVHGTSYKGEGVKGESSTGIGVHATSLNGIALKVDGKSQCGVDVVATGPGEFPAAFHVFNSGAYDPKSGLHPPVALAGHCPNGFAVHGSGMNGVVGVTDSGGTGVSGLSLEKEGGIGVEGHSLKGTGVVGLSDGESGIGVHARSMQGTALKVDGKSEMTSTLDNYPALGVYNDSQSNGMGISANSKSSVAIIGRSEGKRAPGLTGEPGVPAIEGFTQFSFGVAGLGIDISSTPPSNDFISWYTDSSRGSGGLLGYAKDGKGVVGFSDTGIGVLAISKNSPALRVEGKSSFKTVGSGTIPRLRKSVTVNVAPGLVTEKSHISVTLTSDPTVLGGEAVVSWIQRDPGNNRFTINLTKAVGRDTSFTYFIVEP
ncbi:MAG: hypothetical protein QXJ17_07760 [Nitrososphaeria archaeon]